MTINVKKKIDLVERPSSPLDLNLKIKIRSYYNFGVRIFGHLILFILVIICIFPVYWMLVSSLKDSNAIFDPNIFPQSPTLDNYTYVINQIPIVRMLWNTFFVALVTASLHVLTGLMAGYAFARWSFKFDKVIMGLIAMTWLVPFQVTMIPNYILISKMGLLDTLLGLVIPHMVAPFAVMMLYQAIKAFPKDVIEAARIDGVSDWRLMLEIIAPNLRASLVSLFILAFVTSWNEYFWPLLLNRKIENSVAQIGLQMFMTQEGNQWGALMAASTLVSIPILVIYMFLHRHVVESFMRSGLR